MEVDPKLAEKSLAKDSYFVAVKLLLRKGRLLLVTHDIFGQWDIPGGRIRTDQFQTPLEEILNEKVREELGADITYKLGGIATTLRVERQEEGLGGQTVRIFGVCYEGEWISGEPQPGDYHDQAEWIDLPTADLQDYGPAGGWVSQLTSYQQETLNHERDATA